MSNQNGVKHVPAGSGPAYWGPGDQIRFLITGEESGGAFFMAEVLVPPGGGVPPHVHSREEESFYLQEGTLAMQVGGKTLNASPGDFVHITRGTVHSFKNIGSKNAKMLMVATPAGLEKFFAEAFYPAESSGTPPQLTEALRGRLQAAALRCSLELLPPA
jgi:quercetin dioxygenase-like cupin family protein